MHTDPTPSTRPEPVPAFVRVTGELEGRFVEFEFALGDPELAVELVMTFAQFDAFCERHQAVRLDAATGERLDRERMKWRWGVPGMEH